MTLTTVINHILPSKPQRGAGMALSAALVGVLAAALTTIWGGALDWQRRAALENQHSALEAISDRARFTRNVARNVRKASYVAQEDGEAPFAGFAGRASDVRPGRRLQLAFAGFPAQRVEIIAVEPVKRAIGVVTPAGASIELLTVTGRHVGQTDNDTFRFVVAVTPDGAPASTTEPAPQHSL